VRASLSEIEERLEQPTARGLASAVSRAVRDGVLEPGARLPPIRAVAEQLGLSPTTVSAGWAMLARSGTIHTDGRRGSRISERRPTGSRYRQVLTPTATTDGDVGFRPPGQRGAGTTFVLDLSTGVPDPGLLPDLHPVLAALAPPGTPSSYLDDPVLPELAVALRADWPYPAPGFGIFDGAMDALDVAIRTLVGFGDRVLVEHPVFPPLLDLLESAGASVIGLRLDADGVRPSELAAGLARGATAVILQPRAQNPTGVSMSPARAAELAGALSRCAAVVLEDDSAGAVASSPALSLGSWLPERTLHIRSYSKSHGPDLRLAAVSGPVGLLDELLGRRRLGQGWTSRLLQRVLLGLLTDPAAQQQVAAARAEYARRRQALAGALRELGRPVGGSDGINLWLPVADEQAAVVRLASRGIGVAPGEPFGVLADAERHVRITCGLVADGYPQLAAELADAAAARGWSGAR
jgi:DNA-binding transcriptional MocR family regulator